MFTKIARDAICMITNNSNPLGNITQDTIKKIFLGPDVHNWTRYRALRSAAASTRSGVRRPRVRMMPSGTSSWAAPTRDRSSPAKASNGLVQQGVQSDPQAIGYVSLAFTSGVNVVNYNGVDCTLRNATSFQYGGVRSFYFVTRGAPVGGVKKFISWVLRSNKANNIIGTDWVPLH